MRLITPSSKINKCVCVCVCVCVCERERERERFLFKQKVLHFLKRDYYDN